MKNRSAAIAARPIPYHKEYRVFTRSVAGAILFERLEFWSDRYPDRFYKFFAPAPDHHLYQEGDSWLEELGFSIEEFRNAFDGIGIRYKSRSLYETAEKNGKAFIRDDGTEALYLAYLDRHEKVPYYHRNHQFVDELLDDINRKIPTGRTIEKSGNSISQKSTNSISEKSGKSISEKSGLPGSEKSRFPGSKNAGNPISEKSGKSISFPLTHDDITDNDTHKEKGVCAGCDNGEHFSQYPMSVCLDYARSQNDSTNPKGLATAMHKTGLQDLMIEEWLAEKNSKPTVPRSLEFDEELTNRFLTAAREKLNKSVFEQWFTGMRVKRETNRIVFLVFSEKAARVIASNYYDIIEEALTEIGLGEGNPVPYEFDPVGEVA
jgi:hypothetical protein